jgi:hypothetical protein
MSGSMEPDGGGHLDGVGHYVWVRLGRGSVPETVVIDLTRPHGRIPQGPDDGRLEASVLVRWRQQG